MSDQLSHLLVVLLVLPLATGGVVAVLGPRREALVRWISLAASVVTLALALYLAGHFLAGERTRGPELERAAERLPTFRPVFVPGAAPGNPHATTWTVLKLAAGDIQFYLGLDGINVWMVVLTAVLMLPSVLISWRHITDRVNEFYAWLLALQTGMLGVFLAFDIILFYVFFELSLVPLFFLIGIWGGPERRHAAIKFFLFTLVGSVITLLGVLGLVVACWSDTGELTFSIPRLVEIVHTKLAVQDVKTQEYWRAVQHWVFLALMAGFAVKVPLVPLHTWLPLAHVEAPTAGSVDLAGVLLKVGAYGFLRLCLPLAPDVSLSLGLPLVTSLAAMGIIYGAFCAYSQDDVKKLVAYSSVSHLGLCMLGMFSLTVAGLAGSLMQMINHGLSTGALFLLVGMIYERYHTRRLSDYGGMAGRMPLFAVFLVFMCLSSAGLPGLNGFIGEVLVLIGVYEMETARRAWPVLAVAAASGLVLGAWYLLTMVMRLLFGPLREPHVDDPRHLGDLTGREIALIVPLAVLCVAIGVYPQPILDASRADLTVLADIAEQARTRARRAESDSVRTSDASGATTNRGLTPPARQEMERGGP
jgi:NADH-quinone oxidoreductase subunit M